MSDLDQLSGLIGRQPTSMGTEGPSRPGEMGKNDFLKLMIAQLNYQDPLNPMDATQFSAQLAQFTTVEELQNLNTSQEAALEANMILAQSINNTLSSTLIGKQVKAYIDSIRLDDGKAAGMAYNLQQAAATLTVTVRDSSGAVVRTDVVDSPSAGEGEWNWDGEDDFGNRLPDGQYTVEMTASDATGNTTTITPLLRGRVEAVKYTMNGAVLVVDGNAVSFGNVMEISEPGDEEKSGLWSVIQSLGGGG